MKAGLEIGQTAEVKVQTTPEMAIVLGGTVSVFSTPALIWQLEAAARQIAAPYLEAGEETVGTMVSLSHLAPTPTGMAITARARLTSIEGRKLTFQVEAVDEREKIAEGTHERFVIDLARFVSRLEKKRAGEEGPKNR